MLLVGCVVRGADLAPTDDPARARLTTTVRHGLFLTTVRIGGRELGPFLIDTGSNVLVLDRNLARTLDPAIVWAGEHRFASAGSVRDLTVGPITLRAPGIVLMDLSPVTHGFGQRLAGVLGYPFFQNAVVEVNYPQQSVSCFEPSRYQLPLGTWQPLTLSDGRPGVRARLDGAEGMFMVDTGATGVAHLFPHFLATNPGVAIRDVRPQRNLGVEGERDLLSGRIGWFELSGQRLDRPWVIFAKPDTPNPPEATWFDGSVGEEALRRFVVVFNYPARKIAFLPAPPAREDIP